MEFRSTGVLRIAGIAPRVRGVGRAFRAPLSNQPTQGFVEALGYDV